ncbi:MULTISPECIES: serine hydrolase domain-containing protein [Pseudoalteromonas]|uniref:Beta-lactamase-related domain-containing protein n=1 Tax=Pseudoalteromonas amylolytica TaxID=1859457 RepID=A0A1S1MWZ3_9GAMM|nr:MULTISPECIES: serine hydrolase domain-containing protein [Pseudoalteromonas]OHU88103.1 hypothetical protein BFC16_11980 [Pseudoalteromonas sp. JW3]OHU91543.1 hypothetical protein BET10_12100 [Pseudoalteromonas amylolytica]
MKKALLVLLVIVLSAAYALVPVYQGLAYRGIFPLIGFNYITWPSEQPLLSQVHDRRFEGATNKAMEALKQQQAKIFAPGYSAAVAIDGQLIWSASVGWADIAKRRPMNTDTQFRIGSTSKALTATGLARLVANKQFELDEKLANYFDVLPNPRWANITGRQLMSHMAGIPHYKENTELLGLLATIGGQTYYPNVLDAITLFDESDVLFAPGDAFSYSSLGTVLLSAAMQKKTNIKYQNIMFDMVFEPLKMNATFAPTLQSETKNLATFYWQNPLHREELKPWYDVDLSHRLAGGGWVSTPKDLAKLGQGFMSDKFIPPAVRQTFWTPQVLNNGQVNPQKYGLGWRIHPLDLGPGFTPTEYMHHGGVSAGAQSFLMVIPKYKLSIAVNANVRTKVFWHFGEVAHELARVFITELEQR